MLTSQGKKFYFDVLEVQPAPVCSLGAEVPLSVSITPPVELSGEALEREKLRAAEEKRKKEEAKKKAEEERKQKEQEMEELAKKVAVGVKAVQKETNKCWICRYVSPPPLFSFSSPPSSLSHIQEMFSKRIGLTGIKCRCEYTFCSKHRSPDFLLSDDVILTKQKTQVPRSTQLYLRLQGQELSPHQSREGGR